MELQNFYLGPSDITPEVNFSPEKNIFFVRGISSPEDVRAMYYPVIEWIGKYVSELLVTEYQRRSFTSNTPLIFKIDLMYFNSSSAKFLYDIFLELKRLVPAGIPFTVEWYYDEEDIDLRDAGKEIALLAGMEFSYIAK